MEEITAAYVRRLLPRRDPMGHKGTFGKVLCVCGSVGFSGAAVFAGRAAVRTGSGLVYLGVPEPVWPVAAMKCDEVMPFPLPSEEGKLSPLAEEAIRQRAAYLLVNRRTGEPLRGVEHIGCHYAKIFPKEGIGGVELVGCGLGRSPGCDGLVRRLLDLPRPLVLDADGINALSGHMDALSRRRDRITVLTPHEGEFVRAGGDLSPGRERAAADFAREHGVYLVLKGPGTIAAAPDGRCMRNPTGNCGMAKGGSGDVLAGMLVSLLGLGLPPMDACCAAVWLHGRAGDLAAREVGLWGMTPSDLLDRIPAALREVTE